MYIFRTWTTTKAGKRIYARDYGKKHFALNFSLLTKWRVSSMGQFAEESDLIITAGRTPTRGNWVSVEWNGFEVRLADSDNASYSQAELKEMCIKCLNRLFG